jgi:hypothetical protein
MSILIADAHGEATEQDLEKVGGLGASVHTVLSKIVL